jgi:hypothetical protein
MKILGEGAAADRMDASMRFALGLGCIDAMTIGFLGPEECDGAMARLNAAGEAVAG